MKHLVIITGPYFPNVRVYKNLSNEKIEEVINYFNTIPVWSRIKVFDQLPEVLEVGDFKFYLKDNN